MSKIVRNSLLSIAMGVVITIGSCYLQKVTEPMNYAGAMFIFGGLVFLDQELIKKIFNGRKIPARSLIRLVVYLLLAIALIMLPMYVRIPVVAMRLGRSLGIALFLLALWRFFTFTTVGQQDIHS